MPRILMTVGALLLSACAAQLGPRDATTPLLGTSWLLSQLGDEPVVAAAGQRPPFLQLQASAGRVNGFAGCNMFAGPYQLSGESLSFGPLAMTRMACPPPGMTVEGVFATALRDAKGYKLAGKTLTLTDGGGKALASFLAK